MACWLFPKWFQFDLLKKLEDYSMQCRNSLMLSELECSRVISGPYPIWLGDFVSLSLLAAFPILFYLFLVIETKVLPYLLPNATSTVAYKEKTIFPIKICPTVHIVTMFSAWDGKMLKILTQHEHMCHLTRVSLQLNRVLLQCLLLGVISDLTTSFYLNALGNGTVPLFSVGQESLDSEGLVRKHGKGESLAHTMSHTSWAQIVSFKKDHFL